MRIFVPVFCLIWALADTATCQVQVSFEPDITYTGKISSFARSMDRKTNNKRTIERVFNRSHRRFLKHYKAYAGVADVFKKGQFDCLSGTYFLSLSLNELGIRHRIIETNYHVFLIAEAGKAEVLLESTDRYHGFTSDPEKIAEKIDRYRHDNGGSNRLYLSHIKIYHEILQIQLSGLFYFNKAVESFLKNDFVNSYRYLESARNIYDNPRIDEFTPILAHAISESEIGDLQKSSMLNALKLHQRNASNTLAIR